MASGIYSKAKGHLLGGSVDLVNDRVVALLVDTDLYSPSFADDEFQNAIPGPAIISSSTITGKSVAGGIFDGDDSTFTQIDPGVNVGAIIIIKDTGANDTSVLLAYIDNALEFPMNTTGEDITIQWDNGPNKIFRI